PSVGTLRPRRKAAHRRRCRSPHRPVGRTSILWSASARRIPHTAEGRPSPPWGPFHSPGDRLPMAGRSAATLAGSSVGFGLLLVIPVAQTDRVGNLRDPHNSPGPSLQAFPAPFPGNAPPACNLHVARESDAVCS